MLSSNKTLFAPTSSNNIKPNKLYIFILEMQLVVQQQQYSEKQKTYVWQQPNNVQRFQRLAEEIFEEEIFLSRGNPEPIAFYFECPADWQKLAIFSGYDQLPIWENIDWTNLNELLYFCWYPDDEWAFIRLDKRNQIQQVADNMSVLYQDFAVQEFLQNVRLTYADERAYAFYLPLPTHLHQLLNFEQADNELFMDRISFFWSVKPDCLETLSANAQNKQLTNIEINYPQPLNALNFYQFPTIKLHFGHSIWQSDWNSEFTDWMEMK